jgi:uncharacterized membrane protein YkvI
MRRLPICLTTETESQVKVNMVLIKMVYIKMVYIKKKSKMMELNMECRMTLQTSTKWLMLMVNIRHL